MSGTPGYVNQQEAAVAAAAETAAALAANRDALMLFIATWLKAKYGNNAFYVTHPLVSAITGSAAGIIINLDQLQADCAAWQFPAEGAN